MMLRAPKWRREEDRERYEQLVEDIVGERCCVFVGGGLSEPARYPGWKELMTHLAKAAGKALPETNDPLAFLTFADDCRANMGENEYYEFLRKAFDPHGKEPYRSIHEDVLEIPFNAFLTTNFDSCLENAANKVGGIEKVHVYPDLDPGRLYDRDIYHLHGRAYDEHGKSTVRTILLTASDYETAYGLSTQSGYAVALDGLPPLRSLLHTVFMHHTVLFVGFSLTDPGLGQVLKASLEEHKRLSEEVSRIDSGAVRGKNHIALLGTVQRPRSEQRGGAPGPEEEAEKWHKEFLREREVSTIRYEVRAEDDVHSELIRIVGDLYRRTTGTSPNGPPTSRSLIEERVEL